MQTNNHLFRPRPTRGTLWTIILAVVAVIAAMTGGRTPTAAALDSCQTGQPYYRDLTVDAAGFARADKVVEAYLNLTLLLAEQSVTGSVELASLCVDELDSEGEVIANDVVFQFDPAADYDAADKARGVLAFLMAGETAADATRAYRLYFDTAEGYTAPTFTDQVELTEESHKGYASFRIVTPGGEYFYHKPGGGFATLLDADGNDWIGWNAANGANGDFRGIPNLLHPNDGGYFHPGRNSVTTTLLSDGPLKATFSSASKGTTGWEVVWDVFPTHARMTLLRKGSANFWWQYEGTPGGALEVATDTLTRSDGSSIKASGTWNTDIPGDEWVYATDPNTGAGGRSLYFIHHQSDTKVDGYKPDGGKKMTIFGFGRSGNQRLLSDAGHQFTFGLTNETAVNGVGPVVNDVYKPLVLIGQNDAPDIPDPGPTCTPLPYSVYASPKKKSIIDGLDVADEDVAKYDGAKCEWSVVFDGSEARLPASANVNALAVVGSDFYLTLLKPLKAKEMPGLPNNFQIDDSDILLYSGGVFSLYFDGSEHGLTTNAERIDAIAFDPDGKLLISTQGAATVPGLAKTADEDVLRFDSGAWELWFDGSQTNLTSENVAGLDVAADGTIYLSVLNAFNVPNAKGNAADIFQCTPGNPEPTFTQCAYELLWRSTDFGLTTFDAIDIE